MFSEKMFSNVRKKRMKNKIKKSTFYMLNVLCLTHKASDNLYFGQTSRNYTIQMKH
jgi:hypothetical protein